MIPRNWQAFVTFGPNLQKAYFYKEMKYLSIIISFPSSNFFGCSHLKCVLFAPPFKSSAAAESTYLSQNEFRSPVWKILMWKKEIFLQHFSMHCKEMHGVEKSVEVFEMVAMPFPVMA